MCLSDAHPLQKRSIGGKSKIFNSEKKTNFIVYWDSTGNEGKLSDYCSNNIYNVIILAFANAFNNDGIPHPGETRTAGTDRFQLIFREFRNRFRRSSRPFLSPDTALVSKRDPDHGSGKLSLRAGYG
jgi:hypothetical protein